MVRHLKRTRFALFVAYIFAAASPVYAIGSVTVMADSSMSMAVAQIARSYSRERQLVVNTSFAPPKAQEAQITEGGAADVLITPQQPWIDELKTQGLVDIYSQNVIARNQLALVGPATSTLQVDWKTRFPIASLIHEMEGEPNFIIPNPETLAEGGNSKEALRNLGIAGDLEPYTLYIKRLSDMLGMVENRESYGVFLYSNIIGRSGLKLLSLLPENTYNPIQYYAVVIAGDNMDEARKFMAYMKSPAAKKILRDNGFNVD